jgi:hypothetical protein
MPRFPAVPSRATMNQTMPPDAQVGAQTNAPPPKPGQ